MRWIRSLLGGQERSSPRKNYSSAADPVFEKLHRFLNDEVAQNNQLMEQYRSKVQEGLDCDELPGANGEFGRSFRNPIPVNGPIGEILYLSNIVTLDGTHIMFHRIGSKNEVDAFETVSLDGTKWDILFLHLYHPRKSRRAPKGYNIARGKERQELFLGTNQFVDGFPRNIQDAASRSFQQCVGVAMRTPELRRALEAGTFDRPKPHQDRLAATYSMFASNERNSARPEAQSVIEIIEQLLSAQLMFEHKSIREFFPTLMTNRLAAGYVFGFHDACFQGYRLINATDREAGLFRTSYERIFGEQAAFVLINSSLAWQTDHAFAVGRQRAGEDFEDFSTDGTPTLGLQHIVSLGFDVTMIERTLKHQP
jgi:hypothetical protein